MNTSDNQPTPQSTTTDINLRVSFYRDGVGYPEAIILFDALGSFSETLVRHLAWAHKEGDDKSAAAFWSDLQDVAELQRRLFNEVNRAAFGNYEASKGRPTPKEANTESAIQNYRKFFDVK